MKSNHAQTSLFRDLATLIGAGISTLEAARRVFASYPKLTQWNIAINALERGNRFSQALNKSTLINRYETELISVAEDSGRLEQGLKLLADNQQKRIERSSRLKSKLVYPMAILVIGIFISTILMIINSSENALFSAVFLMVIQLVAAFWLYKIILSLSSKGSDYWLAKLDTYKNKPWYQRHFQSLLFEVLYWHSCSGIDPKTSFSRISKLIDSASLKKKLLKTSSLCGQGISISNSMRQARLPISSDGLQIFSSGEHAGDIEGALKRQLEIIQFETNLALDNLIEWLPRIFYSLAVIFAALAII